MMGTKKSARGLLYYELLLVHCSNNLLSVVEHTHVHACRSDVLSVQLMHVSETAQKTAFGKENHSYHYFQAFPLY